MAEKSDEELDRIFEKTCERLKDKPEFKSDSLYPLYNQITWGDLEDGKNYDCSDTCMRIWKEKKGFPKNQLKKEYVKLADQLVPEYGAQHNVSSDVYPEMEKSPAFPVVSSSLFPKMEKSPAFPDVSSSLLPPVTQSTEAFKMVSSDLIPPPISQSSSTGVNPVSRNVSDM